MASRALVQVGAIIPENFRCRSNDLSRLSRLFADLVFRLCALWCSVRNAKIFECICIGRRINSVQIDGPIVNSGFSLTLSLSLSLSLFLHVRRRRRSGQLHSLPRDKFQYWTSQALPFGQWSLDLTCRVKLIKRCF